MTDEERVAFVRRYKPLLRQWQQSGSKLSLLEWSRRNRVTIDDIARDEEG